ncbi:hypothetical protein Q4595_19610, partial [Wenyingzhuangia sp. 1_MG-2023]|nr:hypothetical protein [Wenyingzhuangia sp. 1_MG-2023]
STRSVEELWMSIAGFVLFYTALLVAEVYLMFKFARLGPSALHTGRYHFEKEASHSMTGGTTAGPKAQPLQARNEQA